MVAIHEPPWTIDELGAAVAAALAEGYDGPPNARVRDVPDRRTIRYYTTLGLLDRPVEMRGRTAFYGRRHLFQLVAIKKLQSRGLKLTEVQAVLAGQTESSLARLAGMEQEGGVANPATAPGRPARDFWRQAPAPSPSSSPRDSAGQSDRGPEETARPAPWDRPGIFQGIRLAENVTLLLATSRPLGDEDLETLRKAAAPLIGILTRRQLIPPREEGESA
jgi:DNA-binding transcriptional MerR regulator